MRLRMSTGNIERAIRGDAPESRDHVGKIWVHGRRVSAQGLGECPLVFMLPTRTESAPTWGVLY